MMSWWPLQGPNNFLPESTLDGGTKLRGPGGSFGASERPVLKSPSSTQVVADVRPFSLFMRRVVLTTQEK